MAGLAQLLGTRAGSRSRRLLNPPPSDRPRRPAPYPPERAWHPSAWWLPGSDFLSEQHKDPLFPKPDGGYVSPRGNELGFREPSLLERNLKLGDSGPARDPTAGCCGVWSRPGSAQGGWPAGAMCFAEGKRLKPDIALFVFPVKKKKKAMLLTF